jgi:hypothetical protein
MGFRYARSACWGKTAYATHSEALAKLSVVASRHVHGAQLITYRCQECHRWHIGGGKVPPDPRINPKQWKNWKWRDQT